MFPAILAWRESSLYGLKSQLIFILDLLSSLRLDLGSYLSRAMLSLDANLYPYSQTCMLLEGGDRRKGRTDS